MGHSCNSSTLRSRRQGDQKFRVILTTDVVCGQPAPYETNLKHRLPNTAKIKQANKHKTLKHKTGCNFVKIKQLIDSKDCLVLKRESHRAQVGFELTVCLLVALSSSSSDLLPAKCWIYSCIPPTQLEKEQNKQALNTSLLDFRIHSHFITIHP